MNRTYRLIWNESLNAFVPAPEWARARGKRTRGRHVFAAAAAALASFGAVGAEPPPTALPTGGQVVSGQASLTSNGARLDVHQSSNRAIIDWQRFDVGRDATVNFAQPSRSAVALNRVLSAEPSAIFGQINANGQVFLSSPGGVLFGPSARVDVGGLVATSMQVDPDDFAAGRLNFSGGAGAVVNQGVITATDGGFLALMAPEVRNEGVLRAHLGTVAMAAGEAATLHFADNQLLGVQVDPATVAVLLENRHLIEAGGGRVILSASAAQRLVDQAIAGTSGATGLVTVNGTARLVNVEGTVQADAIAIDGGGTGVTRVVGLLDASSSSGSGGDIQVTGDKVLIDAGARLDASGRDGGTVLVGGGQQGADPHVRNAQRLFVDAAASISADGVGNGSGGRVITYSRQGTQVYGALTARGGAAGGNGGFIETSGGWLDIGHVPDASAVAGRAGEWLIDPFNITIQAAGADTNIGSSPNWESTGNNAILTTASLQSALNAGTSVTITTGSGGAQGGDIVVADPVAKTAGGAASLSFNAHRDIVIDAPISSTSGALSIGFNADIDNDLAGAVVFNSNLTTLGGAVTFNDGVIMSGPAAQSINTSGGAGGNVTFSNQVLIGNTNGVTITTGGGNVLFSSLLDSANDYTFVASTATWTAARTAAATGTGADVGDTYLATSTSPLEASLAASIAGYQSAWLGGSDAAVEGTWRWVTGPEGLEESGQGRRFFIGNRSGVPGALTGFNGFNGAYVNWNSGEPNDAGGEDALQLGFGPAGQWNDFPINANTLPYVVETNLAASPLTLSTGSGSVTFNAAVGSSKALGALTISGSGNVLLNTNTVNVFGNINLNAGGDIILGASNSPVVSADNGVINVARSILKNAGADAGLTLRADGDIVFSGGADITSTSNRLAVTLNSDIDGDGGAIALGSGSVVTSNGGNVTLGGGADPTIGVARGTGASSQRGIVLDGAQINAGAGNVLANGQGGTNAGIGIDLVASSIIETTSGSVTLNGTGSSGASDASIGISVFDGSIVRATAAGGSAVLNGTTSSTGGFATGINIELNSSVQGLNGANVTLTGSGSANGVDNGFGFRNHGVLLQNSSSVLGTGGGAISITGTAGAGGSGIATLTGSNLIGNSSGFTGSVTLTADSMAFANLGVRSAGALTVRPLGTGTTIGVGNGASGALNLSAAELALFQDGFSSITIGRSNGTGDLDIRAHTFTDPLTFVSGAGDGDITVNAHLQNSGGSIALQAGDSITVATTGDITTQGGAVTLNSDFDASGAGGIALGSGAALTSNGGNITLRGGQTALGAVNDPTVDAAAFLTTLNATGARGAGGYGIDLDGATLAAGGGNIELRGVGDSGFSGVRVATGSNVATTGTGQIALYGVGGSAGTGNFGVNVTDSAATVASQGGELRIHGLGRGTNTNPGVLIDTLGGGAAATVSSVDGNIVVRGASTGTGTQNRGVLLDTGPLVRTTGAGNIDIVGRGSGTGSDGTGIQLLSNATVQTTGNGGISLTGFGSSSGTLSNNEGVKVDASLVEVQGGSGDLVFNGFGGSGQSFNIGVNVRVGGIVRMGANAMGEMIITGTGGNGSVTGNWGILVELDGVYESLGAAPISLIGSGGSGADNQGIRVTGGNNNRIGSSTMTGDIRLTADTMDLQGSGILAVRSGGNLVIEPFTAGTTIGLGNAASGVLNLNTTELSRLANGFSQITIGRSDGTGAIDVEAGTFNDPVRLLNTGAGSAGIDFDGVLNAGGNQLWLSSAGAVTQSAGITASQLLLTGSGPFTLTHAANTVGTLAGAITGNLSYNNSGSLTVGSLTGGGTTYNGIANSGGTVLLTASGAAADLNLQQAISATANGTSLQLVAGRNFINTAGAAALDAGLGRWLVWSTDPANSARGGLAYDFKHYGATFGVTTPGQAGGDGFLYTLAPTLTVALSDISRTYDGTNVAALSSADFSVSGQVDGDTVAVGTPLTGTFDSKDAGTGKTVTAAGISLSGASDGAATVYGYQLASSSVANTASTITPQALTITADDSTRIYGDANPAFTAQYSGFVAGEDQSVLGGALAFATPAAAISDVGDYSVAALGLTSTNYAISYVAGTLTVTPAALTVAADDQVKVYGDADPTLTYTVGGAGLRNGDVLAGSLFTASGAQATAGAHVISQGSLAAGGNYTITFTPGTLSVAQAPLLVTADDLARAVFTENPPLTATLTGLRYADDAAVLTGLALSTDATTDSTPGTYAIRAGGATAANYSITFADGQLEVLARSALDGIPEVESLETLNALQRPAVIQVATLAGPLAGESNLSNVIVDGGIALASAVPAPSASTSMSGGFLSVEPLSDVAVTALAPLYFALPAATFRHSDPDVDVAVFAISADGSALPEGLSFDPASGVLSGTLPADRTEVEVLFVARDSTGSEARTRLKLRARR